MTSTIPSTDFRPERHTMKRSTVVLSTVALAFGFTAIGTSAFATPAPYTIVVWSIDSGSETDLWPQTVHQSKDIGTVDLAALDASFECGTAYQVDVYDNSDATRGLVAGGVLDYTDGTPVGSKEDHVENAGSGFSWKVLTTADCAPVEVPTDVCLNVDGIQETIPEGMEAGPVVEGGPTCVPADEACPGFEVCPVGEPLPPALPLTPELPVTPELAHTGPTDATPLIALGGFGSLLVAAGAFLIRRRWAA